jgi:phage baseplate assembly protein W
MASKAQYRGFNTVNNRFGGTVKTDIELVKQDLLNHFAIRKGEKLLQPEFGCDLLDLIMEPLDQGTKDLILEEVTRIINSEPRVRADQILLDEYEHGVMIDVSLTYIQNNQSERMLIQFSRQDGTVIDTAGV